MDFRFYTSLFLRRLHWFLLFLVIGSAIGLTLAKVLPAVYVARAQLLVEAQQIPGNLAVSTVATGATEQLQIIRQQVLARDTLVDLANDLSIYGTRERGERPRMDPDELVKDMRQRISIVTTGGTQRRGAPENATFVDVAFEADNARMSAAVANALVTLIQGENIRRREGAAGNTLQFFEQKVERLDNDLVDLGAKILQFQEANLTSLPDSLEFRRSQQASNEERRSQLVREEARLKDRRSRLVELYENLGPQAQAQPAGPQTPEMRQLQTLKDDMANQLLVLSPENPKIKILQARINAMQPVVDRQQANAGAETGRAPGLTQFDVQLAEIDGQLEYIKLERDQAVKALEGLQNSIEATPGNASTLETLLRERDNIRSQYDIAVAKKAEAATGDFIEALGQGGRIRTIEQAVIPSEPERPNRVMIAAGGIGGGFMLGLAMVVLLELLNKGIRRPVDLINKLGITPFATLPYYRTIQENRRRRSIIVGVLGVVMIGIPALLWGLDTYVMPLGQMIDTLGSRIGLAHLTQPYLHALV